MMFSKIIFNKMIDKNIFVVELCSELNITEREFLEKLLNPELLTIREANSLIKILGLETNIFFCTQS